MSQWTARIGDPIVGGQCPTFDDIGQCRKELQQFTNTMFEDNTSNRWNRKVGKLLVLASLLRWDQFCEVPRSKKRGGPRLVRRPSRPPLCLFFRPRSSLCLSHQASIGESWRMQHNVQQLESCHLIRLPSTQPASPPNREILPCGGGENSKKILHGGATGSGILMDPRCFVSHFNALASATQNIQMSLQLQQHAINDTLHHQRCEN